MPDAAPRGGFPDSLFGLFRQIRSREWRREYELVEFAIPRLAACLAFELREVHLDRLVGNTRRADALFWADGAINPHVVVDFKRVGGKIDDATDQLKAHLELSHAPTGLLLTPRRFAAIHGDSLVSGTYDSLAEEDCRALESRLRRPTESGIELAAPPTGESEVVELLDRVASADSSDARQQALETFAERVFSVHAFLRCKSIGLRTRSGEIDVVCEFQGADRPHFLDDHGRLFLVECRNWGRPACAGEVRDFLGKLEKTRTRLGVMFSRDGITGEARGTDAVREIHAAYGDRDVAMVVVSAADLPSVASVEDVLSVVESKVDALRFDL